MAETFSFEADDFLTDDVQPQTRMSIGQNATGTINSPSRFSATAGTDVQAIDTVNDVDIFAMQVTAGQEVTFDIDFGIGGASSIDLEITIVDNFGNQVGFNDTGGRLDPGSSSGLDPFLQFTAIRTGVYFVAITQNGNDYINGDFDFDGGGTGTGDYQLNVSVASLPALIGLSGGNDVQSFGASADRVEGRGGDDSLSMGSGDDIASGGSGFDTLAGGDGDDQLTGGTGFDELMGNGGNDAVIGGPQGDLLDGGSGDDDLMGGADDDQLIGNNGQDVLWGEGGSDELGGGFGHDTYVFARTSDSAPSNPDLVFFDQTSLDSDIINLAGVFDGTLSFIGHQPFHGIAGELRDKGRGFGLHELQVDVDGDAVADMKITARVDFDFRFGDFIL